ncbi:MAG: DUF1294 domain-containing protein [Gemmatimonadetes bacterium]|nr:DUF1294 domain-containing protein [Gemmatimonadota bacterium]
MQHSRKQGKTEWRSAAGSVFLAALVCGWGLGRVPLPVAAGYIVVSAVTLLLYRRDKQAERAGDRRTPERTLHLASLLGGWPGGLIAQGRFRHKNRKARFQLVFWAAVTLNCVALAWALAPGRA